MPETHGFTPLAVITQPHGVSGRVKLKILAESAESFRQFLPKLCHENGEKQKITITGEAKGQLIVSIASLTDRNAAERWKGVKLGVFSEDFMPLAEGEGYYVKDLVGLVVLSPEGTHIGHITQMLNFGAGDIVELETPAGMRELYAFTEVTFPSIDLNMRTITFVAPELLPVGEEAREAADDE
jgi:16S rRNA processing protein RimM